MRYLFVALLCSNFAWAEDIEEAQGLEQEAPVENAGTHSESTNWRHRSYILLEGVSRDNGSRSNEFPNLEGSLSADYNTANGHTFFLDGIVNYTESDRKTQGYMNQLGARFQVDDRWSVAVGKERNRRSPGIIISPSDPLFAQTNLPGLREDRRGVWLGRASYQTSRSSYDVFLLPVSAQNDGGWPREDSQYMGTMGRTLQQFENWDVSLSVGRLDQVSRAGFAVQGVIHDLWKIYYEAGYYEKSVSLVGLEFRDTSQHLAGIGFEGSDDFSIKGEYFFNGLGLNDSDYQRFLSKSTTNSTALIPFARRQYVLISGSAMEVFDRYNLISSVIKSLEDSSAITLLRAEYLATDHMVTGVTAIFLAGVRQYNLDLKYTF